VSLLAMSNTTPFGFPIPTARKISPLRQRMIDDMTVRNFAPNTVVNYLKQVSYLPDSQTLYDPRRLSLLVGVFFGSEVGGFQDV
jgi:hypothetical protein